MLFIAAPPNHSTSPTPPALLTSSSGRLSKQTKNLLCSECGMHDNSAWLLQYFNSVVDCSSSKPLHLSHSTCTPN